MKYAIGNTQVEARFEMKELKGKDEVVGRHHENNYRGMFILPQGGMTVVTRCVDGHDRAR